MENLEVFLSLIGTSLSLLVACIVFLIKLIQSIHSKKKRQNCDLLLETVAPIVEIAEGYTNYSGEEKKEFVMTKVNQFAIENGIAFNTKLVSEKIEELISLSKKVNSRNENGNG